MHSLRRRWLRCFIPSLILFTCWYSADEYPAALALTRRGVHQGVDQSSIRVKVELVSTPVVVQNEKGALVNDLGPRDFRIFDNGIEQSLESFEIGGAPLAAVFVIETSTRVEALLPAISRTGLLITQNIIGETGQAALLKYSDHVVKQVDFTNDHSAVETAMANLQSESSDANLYDAIWEAVVMLRETPPARRRAVIAIAEAIDTGSKANLGAIVPEAQIDGITIYAVGLSAFQAGWRGPEKQAVAPPAAPSGIFVLPAIPGSMYTPGLEELRRGNMGLGTLGEHTLNFSAPPIGDAAAATGGLYQSTFTDDSIERAIDRIAGELTAQYTLSYRPNTNQTEGDFHKIKVVVVNKGKLRVRSRPGYYVNPGR
jgi:VWFA-related protein